MGAGPEVSGGEAVDDTGGVEELNVLRKWRGRAVDFEVGTGGLMGAPSSPHAELVWGNTLGNERVGATPAQRVPGK